MTDARTITIVLQEPPRGGRGVSFTATITAPHKGPRGIKHVPMHTMTRTLDRQFSDLLTPELMKELHTAIALVVYNWYEIGTQEQLPLE